MCRTPHVTSEGITFTDSVLLPAKSDESKSQEQEQVVANPIVDRSHVSSSRRARSPSPESDKESRRKEKRHKKEKKDKKHKKEKKDKYRDKDEKRVMGPEKPGSGSNNNDRQRRGRHH